MTINRTAALVALGAWALAGAAAPALGDVCHWRRTAVIYNDPPAVDASESGTAEAPEDTGEGSLLDELTDVAQEVTGDLGFWQLTLEVDADPWIIHGSAVAHSTLWGFSTREANTEGKATWRIERIGTCIDPIEDIEVDVAQEFLVYADLRAAATTEAAGRLKFWCASTRSTSHPYAVSSEAVGGLSLSSQHASETETVDRPLFGGTVTLDASASDFESKWFTSQDSGHRGRSPEIVNTVTGVSVGMELRGAGNAYSGVVHPKWKVAVLATCDGECKRHQMMIQRDD